MAKELGRGNETLGAAGPDADGRRRHYCELFELAPEAYLVTNEDGVIQEANHAAAALLSGPREFLAGRPLIEFVAERERPAFEADLLRLRHTDPIADWTAQLRPPGRAPFDAAFTVSIGRDPCGKPAMLRWILRDVTERRPAERGRVLWNAFIRLLPEAARLSDVTAGILQTIGEAMRWDFGAFWTVDSSANVLRCADTWHADGVQFAEFEAISRQILFQPGIDLPGRVWVSGEPAWIADVVQDSGFLRAPAAAAEWLRGAFAFPIRSGDEVFGVIEFFSREVRAPDREFLDVLAALGSQIGQFCRRKAAEEALRQSEARFRAIFESAAVGITLTDLDGRPIKSNRARQQVLGYSAEELLGLRLTEYTHPDDRVLEERNLTELAAGKRDSYRMDRRYIRKDGRLAWGHIAASLIRDAVGQPQFIIVMEEDVSELKRLEEQLLQSQKMEAIGRLAGGVAHDFNNMLAAIIGYNDLLLRRAGSDETLRGPLLESQRAAERAASLTRQLLVFSRRQVVAPQVLDLCEVVANMHRMLRRLIGEDIELVSAPDPDVGRVKADPGQIEQILLNLAVNARDAMPRGGKLVIQIQNATLADSAKCGMRNAECGISDEKTDDAESAFPIPHSALRTPHSNGWVMLKVSDTGRGMDAETRARIFEPFFTTKEREKGTGLGLSTVYAIVQQSGGTIEVDSEPCRGATFRIYLPRTEEDARTEPVVEAPAAPSPGSETVLLVEDEPIVRGMVREVLRLSGYTVLEAMQGDEALRFCSQHDCPIDLLLTDVVMPGMNGRELAERATELRPEMKVLYMSGYPDDANIRQDALESEIAFLAKPFTPAVLEQKVREVLGAS